FRDRQALRDATGAAAMIEESWFHFFGLHVNRGKLKSAIVVPAALVLELNKPQPVEAPSIFLTWQNFHGPETPHDEVLYSFGGYLGRGDAGFDRVLDEIDKLPAGATVNLYRYELGGRFALENLGIDEIEARNARLKDLVPFAHRKKQFDDRVAKRELKLS